MARQTIEVDREKLQAAINEAEVGGALKNLDALWKATEAKYNAMGPAVKISHSVVKLRAEAWKLEHLTKAGRKGRAAGVPLSDDQKAAMQAGRGVRTSRASKFAADEKITKGLVRLRKEVPERFLPLVDRLQHKGSMKAAVALKCLDCSSYQPVEIRECVCPSCPLYAFRPYKKKMDDEVELPDTELETDAIDDVVQLAVSVLVPVGVSQ